MNSEGVAAAGIQQLREVIPKSGLVYSERGGLAEVLCKPKVLPLKSAVLERIKAIERATEEQQEQQQR